MLPSNIKVFVYSAAISMSMSFDGLARLAQETIEEDPFSGHLFVFFNRRGDKVKILYWDRTGFAIWYKRLEKGVYRRPRIYGDSYAISINELSMILEGLELHDKKRLKTLILN